MTDVLLVGADVALLEGLAQSLGGQGYRPVVTSSIAEAREVAASKPPLVLVVERFFASNSGADLLGIPVAAGGARLLYRGSNMPPAPLLPALQRSVLADLTLPLSPANCICPCVGSSKPQSIWIVVVLPAPLAPRSP